LTNILKYGMIVWIPFTGADNMIKCFTVVLLSSNILFGSEQEYPHDFNTAMELIIIQNENDIKSHGNTVRGYAYGCYDTQSANRHLTILNINENELKENFDEKYF